MEIKLKQDELNSLADEIRSLSLEMKQDAFYTITTTAEVIMKFHMVKSRVDQAYFTRVGVLNALILNNGSLTPTAIGKMIYKTKYTVTRVIDRLEKSGLVVMETKPSSQDKRFKRVYLTQKGIDFIKTRMTFRIRLAKEATSFLSRDEMVTLVKLLRRLRSHLLTEISK